MITRKQVLLSLAFLAGCAIVSQQAWPSLRSESEVSTQETNILPQETATLTPRSVEVTPSVTPWVHPTVPPGLLPTPLSTPDDATLQVIELLETNGGCELPCWWGVTPGITKWEEVWQRFAKLVGYSDFGDPLFLELESYFQIGISFPVSTEVWVPEGILDSYSQTFWFGKEDHVVEALWAHVGRDTAQQYSISRILSRFGEPTQILIGDKYYASSGHVALGLKLVYQDLGLLFQFEEVWGPDKELSPPKVCFSKGPHVIAWNKNSITAERVALDRALTSVPVNSFDNSPAFTDIEAVSGESITQFTQRFISEESEDCIDVNWDALH